jgi:hypothetical protein
MLQQISVYLNTPLIAPNFIPDPLYSNTTSALSHCCGVHDIHVTPARRPITTRQLLGQTYAYRYKEGLAVTDFKKKSV